MTWIFRLEELDTLDDRLAKDELNALEEDEELICEVWDELLLDKLALDWLELGRLELELDKAELVFRE